MKALFAFLFLSSLAFACVCSGNISSSFSSFSSHVREKLNAQSQSLSVLTQSIQKNTQILTSQNILLKQELAEYTERQKLLAKKFYKARN